MNIKSHPNEDIHLYVETHANAKLYSARERKLCLQIELIITLYNKKDEQRTA